MKLKTIIGHLEDWAPSAYQESYDNSRLIVGNPNQEISKAIICLDAIEEVIDEAIEKNANLVIAHHPIVFSGLKSFTGKNYIERTVMKAIKNDIAIYAIHTNLDNVKTGVNKIIADKIGLTNQRILAPKSELLCKMAFFTPTENVAAVKEAVFAAGAGSIENYSECSFDTKGTGTFKGNDNSNPVIGKRNERESVEEIKTEVIFPRHLQHKIVGSLQKAHPYETVAYDIFPLLNTNQTVGSGMVGILEKPMAIDAFFAELKSTFQVPAIRHTKWCKKEIKKVALCGGSGSFLLNHAKRENADIFITGDYKYHQFFDAEDDIIIADIGHYESEQYTMELLYAHLTKKIPNFALLLTGVNTNPVQYYI